MRNRGDSVARSRAAGGERRGRGGAGERREGDGRGRRAGEHGQGDGPQPGQGGLPGPRLEPHPEWTEPRWSKDNYELPYAAGIPGELRIVFIPVIFTQLKMKSLEPGVVYRAFFFDPRTGDEHALGDVAADAQGIWQAPLLPTFEQWVLVMERKA